MEFTPSTPESYFDNSTISRIRSKKSSDEQIKNERVNNARFLQQVMTSYSIQQGSTTLTPKQFSEIISEDKPKKLIIQGLKPEIQKRKQEIKNAILTRNYLSSPKLFSHYQYLYNSFFSGFSIKFPQNEIYSRTHKNLKKYPFTRDFFWLEKLIIRYAKQLTKTEDLYYNFVDTLAADSAIRIFLGSINFNELSPDFYDAGETILDTMCGVLVANVRSTRVLDVNLSSLMHALMAHSKVVLDRSKEMPYLMGLADDMADPDGQFFPFFGIYSNNRRYPSTVFTQEPIERVKERLKIYSAGLVEIGKNRPPLVLIRGRVIVLDFERQAHHLIGVEDYL
jgi:hypothetical protein